MNPKRDMDEIILAVDIGGTKIACAGITSDGRILSRLIVPTLQKGPELGINQIINLLEKLVQNLKLDSAHIIGIGIGIPAVLEKETDFIIWGPNLIDWKNVDLRFSLEKHFNLPVRIEYDGHTAVMGEWWMGAAKNYSSAVSIVIGTGVGGGLILDGQLIRGFNRLAGAVGWFILERDKESESSIDRALGNWESRTAGPGIARRAKQILQSQQDIPSVLHEIEDKISAKDIFEAAKQGDSIALKVTSEVAELIGMGIANIVSLVNPEIIVLGGSIGKNSSIILAQIISTVERYAQPISSKSVKIVTSQLGADAGLYGAAYGMMLKLDKEKNNSKGG